MVRVLLVVLVSWSCFASILKYSAPISQILVHIIVTLKFTSRAISQILVLFKNALMKTPIILSLG